MRATRLCRSTPDSSNRAPRYDWTSRGRPRTAGHTAGVEAVRRVVEAAADLGIGTLTLFAFSSDNWRRPDVEVRALMRLFRSYLTAEAEKCAENGVRIMVIGRRDRLAAFRQPPRPALGAHPPSLHRGRRRADHGRA